MTCFRDGQEVKVQYDNLVVGDVIKIASGMNIPVDGIIIQTKGDVKANEAAMTGESDDLEKDTMEKCKEKQEEKDAEYGF